MRNEIKEAIRRYAERNPVGWREDVEDVVQDVHEERTVAAMKEVYGNE